MELKKLSQTSLPAGIIDTSYKQFSLLAQAWKKLRVRRISWKGQEISKGICVHVVKQGETITSISKLYGLPILDIAAANKKDTADLDLVFEGQHVNIPSTNAGFSQKCHFDRNKRKHQLSKAAAALGLRGLGEQRGQIITVALPRRLSHVNAKISVLVSVPLIALCILSALQNRAAKKSRHRLSETRPFSERWRTVLSDMNDTDFECRLDSEGKISEEGQRTHCEDHPQAYAKLESDYQKFLNECGMSKYGYFRGGSPE